MLYVSVLFSVFFHFYVSYARWLNSHCSLFKVNTDTQLTAHTSRKIYFPVFFSLFSVFTFILYYLNDVEANSNKKAIAVGCWTEKRKRNCQWKKRCVFYLFSDNGTCTAFQFCGVQSINAWSTYIDTYIHISQTYIQVVIIIEMPLVVAVNACAFYISTEAFVVVKHCHAI